MIKVWHRYRISDGALMGVSLTGTEEDRDNPSNNVEGFGWVSGVSHWRSQRVVMTPDDFGDLSVPSVEDFIPPSPENTELLEWVWDEGHREWAPVETLQALRKAARSDVIAALARLDASLARPLAEAMQAMLSGGEVDSEATARISAINAEKAVVRGMLGEIESAQSKGEVDAVRASLRSRSEVASSSE